MEPVRAIMSVPRRLFTLFACLVWLASGAAPAGGTLSNRARVYALYADLTADFPDVLDIAPRTLMALGERVRVVFVDTRTAPERAVSMLPGAVSEEEFLADPSRYDGALVVAYCTIGYRSGVLAEKLASEHIRVLNLKGGILGWVHEGGPIRDPSGAPTRRVHVYGPDWNLPPPGYTAVW